MRSGTDWYAFTLAFKGVLLEGLEVAFIVLTFGANARAEGTGDIALAAVGALAAVVVVCGVGAFVHRPLSASARKPVKFAVGLLLITFGTFWAGEGAARLAPQRRDLFVFLALYTLVAVGLVMFLRARREQALSPRRASQGN